MFISLVAASRMEVTLLNPSWKTASVKTVGAAKVVLAIVMTFNVREVRFNVECVVHGQQNILLLDKPCEIFSGQGLIRQRDVFSESSFCVFSFFLHLDNKLCDYWRLRFENLVFSIDSYFRHLFFNFVYIAMTGDFRLRKFKQCFKFQMKLFQIQRWISLKKNFQL